MARTKAFRRALATSGALLTMLVGMAAGEIAGAAAASATTTISAVGSLSTSTASGLNNLAVSPRASGDVQLLAVRVSSKNTTVQSVSGGGSTWTKLQSFQDGGHEDELWMGVVGTAGSSTITLRYSNNVSTFSIDLSSQEFATSLLKPTWARDASASKSNSNSSTVTYPALKPTTTSDVYFGFARGSGTLSAGSTAGFNYARTAGAGMVAYNPSVGASVSPTASMSPAGTSATVGALVKVSGTVPPPPAPTVSGISPSSGPAAGGTSVTITGTNFTGATSVSFGSVAAASFTVTSSTSATATAPAGSGTVDVHVTSAGGTSAANSADRYSYIAPPPAAPTVTSISPSSGSSVGGTPVTISGTGFTGATAVTFGGTNATAFTVNSDTAITATAPSGSGAVDVRVVNSGGTSATSAADQFTYVTPPPPSGSSISPVGSLANSAGTGTSSVSVRPAAAGDAWLVTVKISSSTVTVASLSGGGAASWTRIGSFEDSTGHDIETWMGTIATTGASAISVTYTSANTVDDELTAQEFSSAYGSSSTWSVDTTGGQSNPASVTIASPSLTAAGNGELYLGYSRSPQQAFAGSTPGFTYDPTADGNMVLYDTNASGTLAPTCSQSSADPSAAVAVLVAVTGTVSNPPPPQPSVATVGSLTDQVYDNGGTTLNISPQAAGDLLVLNIDSHAPFAASSVDGDGITWNLAAQFVSARGHDIEMWYGTATSPGAAVVTVTWPSPGDAGYWTEYTAQEFSSAYGAQTTWTVDNGQAATLNVPDSTTVSYPTLTPSVNGDLYYGYAGIPNNAIAGTTPGFSWMISAGGNPIAYDPNVNSVESPSAAQSPDGKAEVIAALFSATQSS
ncbi:MAG TPA: IPT/TIG domain-containing protein [Acidimicrobiales bacterium]|nr:IPT/TIG domain-containing protein [Acidimicrobiales bacterium]